MNRKPNIILIYADDLGKGMLSCYGQKVINTPNIDRLANEGMRFTRAYGTAFCAPARASLICGIHDAHAGRWTYTNGGIYKKLSTNELTYEDIMEIIGHSGIEARACDDFLGTVLQKSGYFTGEIGKLEWGFSTTPKRLERHGWDYHYGYYDHIRCHGFYPPFLFENGEKVDIEGNLDPHCGRMPYLKAGEEATKQVGKIIWDMEGRKQYSQDLFDAKIIEFLNKHKDEPFFLFHPSQLPHGPVFYPDYHEQVKDREDLADVEKAYASMVLRLDQTVGMIVDEIERLGLTNDTLFIFTSDNGHEIYYQHEGRSVKDYDKDGNITNQKDHPFRTKTHGDVFNGNASMAGLKFSNWDGGCHVPLIARWVGKIEQNSTSDHLISNYDCMATFADASRNENDFDTDGMSYLPVLLGDKDAKEHEYIVFSSKNGPALVSKDGYKLRMYIDDEETAFQLFDLMNDPYEKNDISNSEKDILDKLRRKLLSECDGDYLNGTPMRHLASFDYEMPTWSMIIEDYI